MEYFSNSSTLEKYGIIYNSYSIIRNYFVRCIKEYMEYMQVVNEWNDNCIIGIHHHNGIAYWIEDTAYWTNAIYNKIFIDKSLLYPDCIWIHHPKYYMLWKILK